MSKSAYVLYFAWLTTINSGHKSCSSWIIPLLCNSNTSKQFELLSNAPMHKGSFTKEQLYRFRFELRVYLSLFCHKIQYIISTDRKKLIYAQVINARKRPSKLGRNEAPNAPGIRKVIYNIRETTFLLMLQNVSAIKSTQT